MFTIICKFRIKKSPHVFKHCSAGMHFLNKPYCLWKKVALILSS